MNHCDPDSVDNVIGDNKGIQVHNIMTKDTCYGGIKSLKPYMSTITLEYFSGNEVKDMKHCVAFKHFTEHCFFSPRL